jgi:glycopeptide antibiotics resistance protein
VTAFWLRAVLSGLVIALASTIARRSPALGSLIVSLPLVSVLSIIWLWRDGADRLALASYIQNTFWFFLPTMPMFLVIPLLLRRGVAFWPALALGCALTIGLYLAMVATLSRFCVRL